MTLRPAQRPPLTLAQSATYLLAAVSEPNPASTTLPLRATSPPSTPGGEQGHADAIWSTKWATKAGGGEVVVTASADHTLKLWYAHHPALRVFGVCFRLTSTVRAGTRKHPPPRLAPSNLKRHSASSPSTSTRQRPAPRSSSAAPSTRSSPGGASMAPTRRARRLALVRLSPLLPCCAGRPAADAPFERATQPHHGTFRCTRAQRPCRLRAQTARSWCSRPRSTRSATSSLRSRRRARSSRRSNTCVAFCQPAFWARC